MSGFQEVAAAIGVAEVALRSILKVYEFLCDLHDAPATIVRLSNELSELTGCFTALSSRPLDRTAREALADLNLSQIISRCGTTCTKLQADLSHWAKSGQEHLYTRLRFRLNRSRIQGVTEQITVAKQTLTLAVTISIRIQQDRILSTMAERNNTRQKEAQDMQSQYSSSGSGNGQRSAATEQDTLLVPRGSTDRTSDELTTYDPGVQVFMMAVPDRTATSEQEASTEPNTKSKAGCKPASGDQDIGDSSVVRSSNFTVGAPDGSFENQKLGKSNIQDSRSFHIGVWKSDR